LEKVDELGISSCAGSARVNVGSHIVNLLAVLFDDNGASSGSGIGCEHYSVLELDANDGGACFLVGD